MGKTLKEAVEEVSKELEGHEKENVKAIFPQVLKSCLDQSSTEDEFNECMDQFKKSVDTTQDMVQEKL